MDPYPRALSRDDLSQWLVHLAKATVVDGKLLLPFDVMRTILRTGRVLASTVESIARYDPVGAACLYEVPPQNWSELVDTNPNGRRGYGLIVSKSAFWYKGGRPAIYTDEPDSVAWPVEERYRLIATDLNRQPKPLDWTHEREWRLRGNFMFDRLPTTGAWWWPCVEKVKDAQITFREFVGVHSIYIMELGRILERREIFI